MRCYGGVEPSSVLADQLCCDVPLPEGSACFCEGADAAHAPALPPTVLMYKELLLVLLAAPGLYWHHVSSVGTHGVPSTTCMSGKPPAANLRACGSRTDGGSSSPKPLRPSLAVVHYFGPAESRPSTSPAAPAPQPHAHGSATLQLPTANGMMVVEDDPAWLPDEKGCAEIRGLLERSPDYIIHLMMFNFGGRRHSLASL